MAQEPTARPVIVGRFTPEATRLMGRGTLVLNEDGAAFEVLKVDPPIFPGGLATVWGVPVPDKPDRRAT